LTFSKKNPKPIKIRKANMNDTTDLTMRKQEAKALIDRTDWFTLCAGGSSGKQEIVWRSYRICNLSSIPAAIREQFNRMRDEAEGKKKP
jgi:hypothetical protein